MAAPRSGYGPAEAERAARAIWAARHLPAADGVVGRGTAPLLRQFEGAYAAGDPPGLVALRAVAADADARYLALAGRRATGLLRRVGEETDDPIGPLLGSLAVWTGGSDGRPFDTADRPDPVAAILGRLAERGLIVTRDASLRVCSYCAAPRSPERIIYQQEDGDTYLVRFRFADGERAVHALAWVDGPWRLLGATALLLHPTLPYVIARYRRKGVDDLVLTSRSSLARLAAWLPGAEVEIVDEGPGRRWAGRPYDYPLRNEFPMGADLPPPAGTFQVDPDVGDSGTGIVPLVPGHGGTDAQIAGRLGIAGWPLATPHGQLATTLQHKYAGLDLPTANEFVLRDLADGGAVFARLRVRRGVPHCAICGTSLVWAPGRAWCLEPARLPAEWTAAYRRLLPHEPPIAQLEIAAWPVSETTPRPPGPGVVSLLECPACERLAPASAPPTCECGAPRRPVGRRLLPSIRGVLGAWAAVDPFPPGEAVRLYLNERRRAPALVHHLAAAAGVDGVPRDVGLSLLAGTPEAEWPALIDSFGVDAVRAALIGGGHAAPTIGSMGERSAQAAAFLARFGRMAEELLLRLDPPTRSALQSPITGFLAELEAEDRAILARWERVRVAALADYDALQPGRAYRRAARFLSTDLLRYRALVAPRLAAPGTPTERAALRTLHHLIRSAATVLAPVAPHLAEIVHRDATTSGTSLFEQGLRPVDAVLLDDGRRRAWDRWQGLLAACDRYRRTAGLAARTPLPTVVVVVGAEPLAEELRGDRPTLERLGAIGRLEVYGPATPWSGRQRDLVPVLSEIQKVYPSEATQIVHLLRRTPIRRRPDGATAEPLDVILQGLPRRILPSMVSYVERLPDRFDPVGWPWGEVYVERPATVVAPPGTLPPLSPDLFRLVEVIRRERRRRPSGAPAGPAPIVVATVDPLAEELRRVAPALAAHLGVAEVRVVDAAGGLPRGPSFRGRSHTGVRWYLYLPGLPRPPRRAKARRPPAAGSRVRAPRPPTPAAGEIDYASPEQIAHAEEVRALMQELDGLLGSPLLGFAKTNGAWEAGLRSRADFETAAFEAIAEVPGFGWPLAESLVEKLGRTPPPRPRIVRPLAAVAPRPAPVGDAPPTAGRSVDPETRPFPVPESAGARVGSPDPAQGRIVPPVAAARAPDRPVPPPSGRPAPGTAPSSPSALRPATGLPPLGNEPPGAADSGAAPASRPAEAIEEPGREPAPRTGPEPDPAPNPLKEIQPELGTDPEPGTALPTIGASEGTRAEHPLPAAETPSAAPAPSPVSIGSTPGTPPEPAAEGMRVPGWTDRPGGPTPPEAEGKAVLLPTGTNLGVAATPAVEAVDRPADVGPALGAAVGASEAEPTATMAPDPIPEVPPLPPRGIDLVVAPTYLPALEEFLEATAAGHRGIALVRESPERIRTRIGQRPAEVYWLTNLGRGPTVKPGDLDGFRAFLEGAVERDGVTAFFFEGLEYLLRLHGADRVVPILEEFQERARRHDARVWLCIHPGLIPPADLDRLAVAFPRP